MKTKHLFVLLLLSLACVNQVQAAHAVITESSLNISSVSPGKEIAGFVSVFALFQIDLILMFYREPLY